MLTGTQFVQAGAFGRAGTCGHGITRLQGPSRDTLRLCAAACDVYDECTAFLHTSARTGGICELCGTLHKGPIPDLRDFGEFTLNPGGHDPGTQQVVAHESLEHLEYH